VFLAETATLDLPVWENKLFCEKAKKVSFLHDSVITPGFVRNVKNCSNPRV